MSLYPKKPANRRIVPAKVADAAPASPPDNCRTFDARPKPSQTERLGESTRVPRPISRHAVDARPDNADGEV